MATGTVLKQELLTETQPADIEQLISESTPAARAAEDLRYRVKHESMQKQPGTAQPHALRNFLARQKIAVLTEASVSEYKKQKVDASQAGYQLAEFLTELIGPDDRDGEDRFFLSLGTLVVGAVGGFLTTLALSS